ncbi:MAG: phosphoesterase [Nitrospirae bacterium]|nr:phosphoesterase [Nitrospirota bacterium]
MSEQIMVLDRGLINHRLINDKMCLITEDTQELIDIIIEDHRFINRDEAENNESFKQIIPYVIIRNSEQYYMLKRTKNQTESRLHNKYSLGIGGHINPVKVEWKDEIIIEGLRKELREEISFKGNYRLEFVGLINDEGSSVSRVHLGLVYIMTVESPESISVLETDKMTGQWVNKSDIVNYYNEFETWSQIAYDCLIK